MQGMTTNDKLLAQDDIDALLGEAGVEGSYESEIQDKKVLPQAPKKNAVIRFAKKSDGEVKDLLPLLQNRALLERDEDVKVIWNAQGTIPMVSGSILKIQDIDYVCLGVLHDNHLVVKCKPADES